MIYKLYTNRNEPENMKIKLYGGQLLEFMKDDSFSKKIFGVNVIDDYPSRGGLGVNTTRSITYFLDKSSTNNVVWKHQSTQIKREIKSKQ